MENKTHQEEEIKKDTLAEEVSAAETLSKAGQSEAAPKDPEDASARDDASKKLQAELAESKDKYLRLYSEFENFRRRTSREKLEMIQSANEQLLQNLLPVVDDFERAEKSFREKNDKDSEGFFLIQNKFKKILEQHGVKIMDVQQGYEFNPDIHEAITQVPAPNEKLKGKVVDVVEKGYLLNDKVIRYAKVVVGN